MVSKDVKEMEQHDLDHDYHIENFGTCIVLLVGVKNFDFPKELKHLKIKSLLIILIGFLIFDFLLFNNN